MQRLPGTVLFCILQLIIFTTAAQNVSINSDGSNPHASAMLDVKSSTKGLLIPRTSSSSRIAIVSPAKGLMVYDTTTSSFWFHNGSGWAQIMVGSNAWNLSGNTASNPAAHFIGTTDAQPLRFRISNSWAGELHPTSGNIFLGLGAGKINTTGQANTGYGEHSLFAITDGNFNTANGYYALGVNTSGYNNTAMGSYSLSANTTGHSNTATGRNALFGNTTGTQNTATGMDALLTNTEGTENTATGFRALFSNTNGSANTGNGNEALYTNTLGNYNTASGYRTMFYNTVGSANTAAGHEALYRNITGSSNTAIGTGTLYSNTVGDNNTAIGYQSLPFNATGNNNTALGSRVMNNSTTGFDNTVSGFMAMFNNGSGSRNTVSGVEALYSNSNGINNVSMGCFSLRANTTGGSNVAVGVAALQDNISGGSNIAIGAVALQYNIGGNLNIAIGDNSGIHSATPNIFNTVSIGNDNLLNAFQNQVIIGNANTGFIGGKVNWSVVSDARIKNSVTEDVKGLDFITRLRPVTYYISNKAMVAVTGNKETPDYPGKYDTEKIKYTGFIAQEVEKAANDAGYEFSGYSAPKNNWGLYTLSYAEFVVPLVKSVQEQQAIILQLQNEIKQLRLLEQRLGALEKKVTTN
jgi:trimeric autotransporter adhesin